MEKNKSACNCGSSDARHDYGDSYYCFSCGTFTKKTTDEPIMVQPKRMTQLRVMNETSLPAKGRNINHETYKKFGVWICEEGKYVFPYYDKTGQRHVANKLRSVESKSFFVEGEISGSGLFGQQLFPKGSAQQITIVEGEFDALAAFEICGSKYPVVSVKSAGEATKNVADNFEYLNSFQTIVICFDKDEPKGDNGHRPGQEAAQKVAAMFPLGKVRVLTLALFKDANDYLMNGKSKEFLDEWWKAPQWVPNGIKVASNMWEEVSAPKQYDSATYPWQGLQKLTYGIRLSEFVTITGDSGIGKSSIVKEIVSHILKEKQDKGAGLLFLEETNADTLLGLMSIEANKPLHLPDVRAEIKEPELKEIFDRSVNTDRIVVYDHFGSTSVDEILSKVHHMSNLGCKYIVIDHLSIVVSDQKGDERKQLDEIATKLKQKCMELNVAVIAVIHLNRQGQIRGTAGVEQLSNIVIKLHRDKEHNDDWIRNVTKVVVVKNRFSGLTGPACYLSYNLETGRLNELVDSEIKTYENTLKGVEEETSW